MLTVCKNGKKSVLMFQDRLTRDMKYVGRKKVNYGHGSTEMPVYVDGEFWCAFDAQQRESGKYIQWFGMKKAASNTYSTNFHININVDESGHQTTGSAGLIVQDEYGDYYIVHSGNVTVNQLKRGATIPDVQDYFHKRIVQVEGMNRREYILVSAFEELVPHLKTFVSGMVKFKKEFRAGSLQVLKGGGTKGDKARKYKKGAKRGTASVNPSGYVRKLRHNNILDSFETSLKRLSPKCTTEETRKVDMIVRTEQQLLVVELKTSGDTQSVYTGIGQSLYHAREYKGARPVLVLPSCPEVREHISNIEALGIRLVFYHVRGKGYSFSGPRQLNLKKALFG